MPLPLASSLPLLPLGAVLAEEKPVGSGSYGWLGAQKASHMRLLSPDAARGALEDAFEGRTRSRLPVVLTTAVMPEGEGQPCHHPEAPPRALCPSTSCKLALGLHARAALAAMGSALHRCQTTCPHTR